MMGRPPLSLGTAGKFNVKEEAPNSWCARCRYRDYDGKIYHVERYGQTRTKAENRLKEALRDWVSPVPSAGISRDTKLREVAAQWFKEFEQDAASDYRSWGSVDTYRSRL
ncbi:MAG: site-specific integrase, partial [Kutzneria sp.]|nr:site-specific integrase [Kutzneria sp.]